MTTSAMSAVAFTKAWSSGQPGSWVSSWLRGIQRTGQRKAHRQIPSSKSQIPTHSQTSKSQNNSQQSQNNSQAQEQLGVVFGVCLGFGAWECVGIWSLELGI